MKQYKSILRANKGCVLSVIILNILTSFAMVFAGYSLSFLLTAYEYEGNKLRALSITFCIVMAIWLIAMGVYYLTQLMTAKAKQRITNNLRTMISEKIASLDYAEFTDKDCGHYVSWLTNDADQIYSQSFASLFSGIENLATAVFSLGALFMLSWYVGVAAIILLFVISVLPQMAGKTLQRANAERSKAMEISTESFKDTVMGGTIFFLNNLRNRIVQRITATSQIVEKVCCRFNFTNATVQTIIATVSMVGQIILLFVTLLAVIAGMAPTGATLSVGNLSGSFFNGAGALVQCFVTVKASKPLWDKFNKEAAVQKSSEKVVDGISCITMQNVSFQYGERVVLKNKNYEFCSGGKYAIMGESGSGKTTLTKILMGLLHGYTGSVKYGSVDQHDVDLESLHQHIAYVDQQVYLFQDTLRFNITLGQSYSEEEIMAVIRKCKLEEYVAALSDGLDSMIMENGKNLSGGQRQRIALARGLIRNVDYIILDEGTSALDENNALDIEESLLDTSNLGVIIITHNLRDQIKSKLTDVYALTA